MILNAMWRLIFWLSVLGVAYMFVGCPVRVLALSRLRPLWTENLLLLRCR